MAVSNYPVKVLLDGWHWNAEHFILWAFILQKKFNSELSLKPFYELK